MLLNWQTKVEYHSHKQCRLCKARQLNVVGLRHASTIRGWGRVAFVQRKVGLFRLRTAWPAGEGAGTAWEGAGTAWEGAGAASAGRQDDDDDDLLLGTTAALRKPKLLLDRVTDCLSGICARTLYWGKKEGLYTGGKKTRRKEKLGETILTGMTGGEQRVTRVRVDKKSVCACRVCECNVKKKWVKKR